MPRSEQNVAVRLVPESAHSTKNASEQVVSAADLAVPGPARKMYEKAIKNMDRDLDGCRKLLEKVLAAHPRFPLAQTMLGLVHFKLKHTDQAAEALGRAIELDPDSSKARFLMGQVRMEQQRYADAETEFLEGLRVDPGDWRGFYELTRCYHKMGRPDKAMEYGRRAHDAPGAPTTMHLVMVDLYAERDDKVATLRELRDFAKADPRSPYLPQVNKRIEELTKQQKD
jgi:tetratricopeptide (TPR) repeat protein